jgi:1-hydroxycarotenoid 3,4-desaturase
MASPRIAVIGAGVAGLAASIDLARQGCDVLLLERAAAPGGKMRELSIAGSRLDAGPTVFTLRAVFDALFADAGDSLEGRVTLKAAHILARHAWEAGGHLDLFADLTRSIDAIGSFAGAAEARAFAAFAAHARRIYDTLDRSFMHASRPSPVQLMQRIGLTGLPALWNIKPFMTLWQAVRDYFADPRLRQLFGRYATYCGSSPFSSPATLMLVAHVEQAGVWYVEGGMHRLVQEMAALASRRGATVRYSTEVRSIEVAKGRVSSVTTTAGEHIRVDAVVCNADNNALATGLFGPSVARAVAPTPMASRSLSAITWNTVARTAGFPLAHHSVFFSADYEAEFDAIFSRRQVPPAPTIYACAQDRQDDSPPPGTAERLFLLINAPAIGDSHEFNHAEIESCENRLFQSLTSFGLTVERNAERMTVTTPTDFHRLFPATGGALYGPASHGWRASFTRPGSRSAIPGLYLAGGSTHPGPGIPMAATSGRLAAASIMADCVSTSRSRAAAMPGGTSMR